MIPTVRLVWLVTLGIPITLLALFGGQGFFLAAIYTVLLVAAVAADRLATQDPDLADVSREMPLRWVQGRSGRIRLHVRWGGRRKGHLLIRDLPPISFETDSTLFRLVMAAGRSRVDYEVVPRQRGHYPFGPVAIRSRGPLGLLERQKVLKVAATARVYPDLVTLSPRERTMPGPKLQLSGYRRLRIHGEGREFHQLRHYVEGDDLRLMDWKAFARRGLPAVRDYRAERNQRVVLVVDAGRLMTFRVADRLRFDWAIQAAGRLARSALGMGDRVGLAIFSRSIKVHLPAGRGPGHLGRLSDLMCEAQPDLDEPDLGGALHTLLRNNPRRALVVVFTEIADPRSAEQVLRHVGALAPRHLGVVVTLADADLMAERETPLVDADAVYRRVSADELWWEYRRTETALERQGAIVIRARADALAAETVERYAEIKRLGRL